MASRRPDGGPLPSPDELLAFIADNPGRASRRDVARAFGVVGARRRADLDRLLRRLEAEGRTGRADGPEPASGGVEPSELLVEVVEIDDEGVAVAEPLTWRTGGPPPKIRLRSRTGPGPRPAPGIGQRAVVRLLDGPKGRREGQGAAARRPRAAAGGRRLPAHAGRRPDNSRRPPSRARLPRRTSSRYRGGGWRPGSRRTEIRPPLRPRDSPRRAPPGRLVRRRRDKPSRHRRARRARAHARGRDGGGRPRGAGGRTRRARGSARRPARHHRRRRRPGPRRRRVRRTDERVRGDVARPRRHRRRGPLHPARKRARPRRVPTRQFGLLSRPRRADAARTTLRRSLLVASGRGQALPGGPLVDSATTARCGAGGSRAVSCVRRPG